MRTTQFDEALPMVGAMACRLADSAGVRALLIKGAPATAQGVRAPRPSADIDLWVDPRDVSAYLDQLHAAGWRRYPGPPAEFGWGHATTMVHPAWPCTIDVHRRFPGFLTDDETAFDLAWRHRDTALMAHRRVAVPNKVVAAAISVLHAARSPEIAETADDRAWALRAAQSFSADERAALRCLVVATRSAQPLADLLSAAGCEAPCSTAPEAARLQEWQVRLSVSGNAGTGLILALRAASWPQRGRLLFAALKPGPKDYAESHAGDTIAGSVRAALYRWRRSARALPGALIAVRKAVTTRHS